jgi:hypothetical protein
VVPLRLQYAGPSDLQVDRGIEYRFVIDSSLYASGAILVKSGVIRRRYETQPRQRIFLPLNLIRKSDFVLWEDRGRTVGDTVECSC